VIGCSCRHVVFFLFCLASDPFADMSSMAPGEPSADPFAEASQVSALQILSFNFAGMPFVDPGCPSERTV